MKSKIFLVCAMVLFAVVSIACAMDTALDVPTIQTEQCILRKVRVDDAPDIFALACDPVVTKYLAMFYSTHQTVDDSRKFILDALKRNAQGKHIPWAIVDKASGAVIGFVGLYGNLQWSRCLEIGYALLPKYWGRGIATEISCAVIAYAFNVLRVARVEALCDPFNVARRRVLCKCGMRYEGLLRKYYVVNGVPCDREIYSMTDDEYARACQ